MQYMLNMVIFVANATHYIGSENIVKKGSIICEFQVHPKALLERQFIKKSWYMEFA